MKIDPVSLFIRKAIDTLFLSHKLRTSLGVIFGLAIHGLTKVFSPVLEQYSDIINSSEIGYLTCVSVGVLGMHAQTIYTLMRRSVTDEKLDRILQLIEEAKKKNLPEWQIRQMYATLYIKALSDADLNDSTTSAVERAGSDKNKEPDDQNKDDSDREPNL